MASTVACLSTPGIAAAQGAAAQGAAAPVNTALQGTYHLGAADRLRITVFGQAALTGEYAVGSNGNVSLPLIGEVPAIGKSTTDLEQAVTARYAAGYLNNPRVSIEVLTYRPFFILGEVAKPGEYPYSYGLTAQNAVALAGGYSYRANKKQVFIRRAGTNAEDKLSLDAVINVNPGDTVRVGERYF